MKALLQPACVVLCGLLSSCALPEEYLSGGGAASLGPAIPPTSPRPLSAFASPSPPISGDGAAAVAGPPPTDELGVPTDLPLPAADGVQDSGTMDLLPPPPSGPATISDADALQLSAEVIPFEQYMHGHEERPRTVTERIDDVIFPQNNERRQLVEERPMDEVDEPLPERRSVFGNDRFLSPGSIQPGIKLPTGAIWRPSFLAFGTLRSALQTFQRGTTDVSEWVNRLDLFGNLSLSSTERVLIGLRPFDQEGAFSGYTFGGGSRNEGWANEFSFEPQTLFFEGDFGEIFPFLDPQDKHHLDYQFSIGRQPLLMQSGIMANDNIDSIGITRHNLFLFGASSARVTGWFGLNNVHRGDNIEDSDAHLIAISSALDYDKVTLETDAAYVTAGDRSGGDGAYLGIGHIRRFGQWNSTLRGNASWALERSTAAVDTGYLLTHELSRTMPYNSDILYLNSYVGIDHYTAAARGPATGGPLGRVGLLNRAVGIGSYGAPLTNNSGDTLGASLGYQHFFDDAAYHQLLVEVGARKGYASDPEKAVGSLGAQYQWGFGRGLILILGGYGSLDEAGGTGYGARSELTVKF